MSKNNRQSQSDILDKILSDSQEGRGDVVWISDPRHPDGGYYVTASGQEPLGPTGHSTLDEIEKYLRS